MNESIALGFHHDALFHLNFIWDVAMRGAGAPGGIRTPDPQIRSLVLWSAELRAQE